MLKKSIHDSLRLVLDLVVCLVFIQLFRVTNKAE